jgi:CRP-like cAMP-binding protein
MAHTKLFPYRNALLCALSRIDRARLQPHLKLVAIELRQDMEKPNERVDFVYFIERGIASVVAVGPQLAEIGIIGPEGMTGTTVVLGNRRSPHAIYVQAAGEAQRIRTTELRRALAASPLMHGLFLKYVQTFMVQTAHTAIANARGTIPERLARWLLMAHDRLGQRRLPLTHEFLSLMLAVRRPGVTDAVNALSSQGMIKAGRGEIIVLDRGAIERCAKDLYGIPEAEYRRLLGRG